MEFTVKTHYNHRAFKAMFKAVRHTVRKEKNHKNHFASIILSICCILLPFVPKEGGFRFDIITIISFTFVFLLMFMLLFEDDINSLMAKKYLHPAMENVTSVFTDDGYITIDEDKEKMNWEYDRNQTTVEVGDYIIFIINEDNVQIQDKRTLTGGTVDEFRTFIERKTRTEVIFVK